MRLVSREGCGGARPGRARWAIDASLNGEGGSRRPIHLPPRLNGRPRCPGPSPRLSSTPTRLLPRDTFPNSPSQSSAAIQFAVLKAIKLGEQSLEPELLITSPTAGARCERNTCYYLRDLCTAPSSLCLKLSFKAMRASPRV